jgi:hypothetical protein
MKLTNAIPHLVQSSSAGSGAATNDIRGIKPPIDIPSGWAWVGWTLAVVVLVAALVALWYWWRRKASAPVPVPIIPPHVRARQRLQAALQLISEPRLFCIAVSDALRVYLEERFQLRAPERTTEEFLQDLQGTGHLNAAQKLSLTDFLERCDLVKFARFEPTEAALRDLHESALRLVDETQFEPISVAEPAAEASPPPLPRAP